MEFHSNVKMTSRRTVDLVTANSEELRESEAKARKYVWFLLAKVLLVLSLIAFYKTWQEFHLTPIFTGIDLNTKEQPIEFPSVFICPKDTVDYGKLEKVLNALAVETNDSRGILAECLGNLAQFSTERTSVNESCHGLEERFSDLKIKEAVNQIQIGCEDYIFNCTFKGHPMECCRNIFPMRTEKGQCFVFNNFNTNFNSSSQQIWSSEENWRFTFNTYDTEVDIDIYLKGFYDTLLFSDYVDFKWQHKYISTIYMDILQNVSTAEVRELTLNQRQCIFSDERGPFQNPHGSGYNYDICLNECHLQAFIKACGCVPLFYQDLTLVGEKGIPDCKIHQSMCVKDNVYNVTLRSCNCPRECNSIIYTTAYESRFTQMKNAPRKTQDLTKNSLTLDLKAWPIKRFKNDVIFGWNKLSLPLGGIAGIFLGISFLSTLELMYRLAFRFCCTLLLTMRVRKEKSDLFPLDPMNCTHISHITPRKNQVEPFSQMDIPERN